MKNTLKVVIPMAGLGTRLRPHTWSKPKQLVSVAGKPVLDHVLDMFSTLPNPDNVEFVNIVGYLGDQIEDHMQKCYPHIKSHFVVQDNPKGQSHAIYLARQYLTGPMMVVFADTLIETDLSNLLDKPSDAVAWVKPVPDPRRFGVAVVDQDGRVTQLIEKPKETENNLAVVGFYYFRSSEALIAAIEEQMQRDLQLKGEYFLVDAINIMLEKGITMHTEKVDVWLDAGTPDALLETNRYLLKNGHSNSEEAAKRSGVVINPPVFVHPSAELENCVIGPYASIGSGAQVSSSIVRDSILEDEAQVSDVILERSLIGRRSQIQRRAGSVNAGDNTVVSL
ncbi:MAG: NTP transferase domain-containing protein [Chloroflexota bacterium]|nr:MAG: NTP transferase domain-containing protein [Chloroflexota bacterium]